MTQYFHTVPSRPGLNVLQDDACELLNFAKLNLAPGERVSGTSGDRELLLVALSGRATVQVGDRTFEWVGGRASVFAGLPHSVYVPRGTRGPSPPSPISRPPCRPRPATSTPPPTRSGPNRCTPDSGAP